MTQDDCPLCGVAHAPIGINGDVTYYACGGAEYGPWARSLGLSPIDAEPSDGP